MAELPVSVVIPVRNEEANLGRCLGCLGDFSEVIVVDSGSEDATVAIAEQHGREVVPFQWNGQFPKKRNWVLRNVKLRHPWVLFLDADEYLSAEFVAELGRALAEPKVVGFWLNFQNTFLGNKLRFGDRFRKLALFRKGAGEYEKIDEQSWSKLDMEVHEHPILAGPVGEIRSPIRHEDDKGMTAYIDRHNAYSTWEARRFLQLQKDAQAWEKLNRRQKLKYRLMDSWILGPGYFIASYFLKLGFLDGKAGFIFALSKMIYFIQIKCKIEEIKNEHC